MKNHFQIHRFYVANLRITISQCAIVLCALLAEAEVQGQPQAVIPYNLRVGQQGDFIRIVGPNRFFPVQGVVSGNLTQVIMRKGQTEIVLYDSANASHSAAIFVQDTSWVLISVPPDIPLGAYDLIVKVGYLYLTPSQFVVDTLHSGVEVVPAQSYLSGSVFIDYNENGVRDTGEVGLSRANVEFIGDDYYSIQTNTLGDFILGVDSGYYDVSLVALPSQYYYKESMPDTSQIFARDSVSNIIIGARSPIRSISPSKGFPGQSCITATIVAEGIFAPTQFPSGNVTWGRVSYGNFYGQSNGNSVEYVSQDTIRVTFDLPDFTPLGLTPVQVCCSGSAWFCCISAPLFEVEPAPSRISGKVYYDANSNGQFDVGEPPIGFQKILVDPGPSLTYSSTIGDYSCPASVGQHNVRFQSSGPISYLTSNPSSYSFTNTGDTAGVNFGLHSNAADYTTTISLSPGWPRCGNPETYVITIMNISNVASQGTVQAYKSQQQLYISMNPNTGVIHNDTLTWSFSNLQPMQTMTFTYTVQNPISGILRNSVRVNVMDPAGNVLFSDGTTTIEQIVCSFDPNDKHVSPEGYDPLEHYTNSSDSLVYTIRFQNTGTDSAIRIVVLDTISPWLDLSTFELLHSSHPMNITLDSGRVVRFLFDNIRLPDSTVDEPGSHGLIRYRIWPYPGLPEKTRVENTAYIFFDFNLPVQTNTVWNSMVSVIPLGFGESEGLPEQLAFFPNPVQDRAQLLFRNDAAEEAVLSVFNLNGRLLEKIRTNSDRFEIKREGKSPGLYQYFIDCQTSGKRLQGRFIVE